jgi:predicted DNA-binding protein (MmcQ/YjbR family)
MTYDEFNDYCRSLPATSYVVQWGGAQVWKVGGKVFAIGGWEKNKGPAFTFKTSRLNFEILKDEPGFCAAPYLAARGMSWIQQHDCAATDDNEIKKNVSDSHRIVSLGLIKKKRQELGLAN